MQEDYAIRPYAPGDAQAFHDLNLEWLTAYFRVEPKDEATLSDPEGTLLAPGGQIFLADVDGVTVGCVALVPIPDGYEVAKMAVAPAAQGRGVGRRLLETVVAWAQSQGARCLYLESNARLAPALHLYESLGFRHLPPGRTSPYARADVFMEMTLEDVGTMPTASTLQGTGATADNQVDRMSTKGYNNRANLPFRGDAVS